MNTYTVYIENVVQWFPRIKWTKKKLTIKADSLNEALAQVPAGFEVSMFWLNWP